MSGDFVHFSGEQDDSREAHVMQVVKAVVEKGALNLSLASKQIGDSLCYDRVSASHMLRGITWAGVDIWREHAAAITATLTELVCYWFTTVPLLLL